MLLGGKVHNPSWAYQLPRFSNEHSASDHLTVFTGFGVTLHIGRKAIFELQSNAFAHHAHGVNRIHQGFHIRVQQVTCCVRSEEHTSELQSRENLVCRLLLEKKNTTSP